MSWLSSRSLKASRHAWVSVIEIEDETCPLSSISYDY